MGKQNKSGPSKTNFNGNQRAQDTQDKNNSGKECLPVSEIKNETSIFIDNLPSSARNQDVAQLFKRFGRCDVQIENDWTYAFVDFESPQSARRAVESLHKTQFKEQEIEVIFKSQI